MGAQANCCKQPETVFEEENECNTVGEQNEEEKIEEGFPRDSKQSQLRSYKDPVYCPDGENQMNQSEQANKEEMNNTPENAEPNNDAAGYGSLEFQSNQVSAAEDLNVEQNQRPEETYNNIQQTPYGETKVLPTITAPAIFKTPIDNYVNNYNKDMIGSEVAGLQYTDQYGGDIQPISEGVQAVNNGQLNSNYTAEDIKDVNYDEFLPGNPKYVDYTTSNAQIPGYTNENGQFSDYFTNAQYGNINVTNNVDIYGLGANTSYTSGVVEGGYVDGSTTYAQPVDGGVLSNYGYNAGYQLPSNFV